MIHDGMNRYNIYSRPVPFATCIQRDRFNNREIEQSLQKVLGMVAHLDQTENS
jgi:hypothetical protein